MLDVIQVTKHYRSGRGRLKALDQVSFAAADKTISLTDGRVDTITSGDRT